MYIQSVILQIQNSLKVSFATEHSNLCCFSAISKRRSNENMRIFCRLYSNLNVLLLPWCFDHITPVVRMHYAKTFSLPKHCSYIRGISADPCKIRLKDLTQTEQEREWMLCFSEGRLARIVRIMHGTTSISKKETMWIRLMLYNTETIEKRDRFPWQTSSMDDNDSEPIKLEDFVCDHSVSYRKQSTRFHRNVLFISRII